MSGARILRGICASYRPCCREIREARVADHVARVVVDHDELALVRPTVPIQEDPRALVAQQPQLRAAIGGRAVVGDLQLAPARPVLRQEEIVREVGGVGHGERVGREELRSGDRARARHVAAHHAARRHSAARGREGAVQALAVQRAREAAPVIVSVAPVTAPKLAAVAAPEAVSVPVDTPPTSWCTCPRPTTSTTPCTAASWVTRAPGARRQHDGGQGRRDGLSPAAEARVPRRKGPTTSRWPPWAKCCWSPRSPH